MCQGLVEALRCWMVESKTFNVSGALLTTCRDYFEPGHVLLNRTAMIFDSNWSNKKVPVK